MQVLYFAWLRDRVGTGVEQIDPRGAATPRALIDDLVARDPRYAAAFADMAAVRVALDQEMADLDTPLAGVHELAFFPPVTGG